MSAKCTEFCEYKLFSSKISQYKVLSTKPRWEICEKTKKCAKFHKLIAEHGTRLLPDFNSNP